MSTRAALADHAVRGLAAGALFGGLDAGLARYYAPGVHPTAPLLFVWLSFGLLGALAGLALGAALQFATARRSRLESGTLGALLTLYGLVLLVINLHVLRVMPGDLLSPVVLGTNAALIVALVAAIRLTPTRKAHGPSGWIVIVVWFLAMGVFAASLQFDSRGLAARTEAGGGQRDVLWIVMDTTRADSVLIPGATPSLERLATAGARFENAYSAASWTLPSHASMFTGSYPSRHGLTGLSARFVEGQGPERGRHLVQDRLSERTIADIFRTAGYATVGFSENPWVGRGTGLATGFGEFYDTWEYPGRNATVFERILKQARIAGLAPVTHTHRTVAAVRRWLHEREAERPFFVFVNFLEAHAPYAPPPGFSPRNPLAREPSLALQKAAKDPLSYVAGQAALDVDEIAALRSLYQAEVTSLDAAIGELIDFLEASELLADAIVIVTSDHGENFGWRGLASHAFAINEALIRVPLVVHAPGVVPPGRSIAQAVSLVDLFPTLLALCGVPFDEPERLQGESLVPLFEAEPDPTSTLARRAIFAEDAENRALLEVASADYPEHDWSRYARSQHSVLREGMKYVRASDGDHGLYDLVHDPDEQNNLLAERTTLALELAEQLERHVRLSVSDAREGETDTLDPAVEERLRALGYVD